MTLQTNRRAVVRIEPFERKVATGILDVFAPRSVTRFTLESLEAGAACPERVVMRRLLIGFDRVFVTGETHACVFHEGGILEGWVERRPVHRPRGARCSEN